MVKVVIHVGMHKTGSSAIQNFYAKKTFPSIEYANYQTPNHCGLFILLFESPDRAREYHGFRAQGSAFLDTLPDQRRKWQVKLDEQMARLARTNATLIFSAEDISHPSFTVARENLCNYFSRRADEVRVVGYVRPPLSFACSAFQEMLKGSDLRSFKIDALWPEYRARFEPLDKLFGRENVSLKIYARDRLYLGDIISDFGRELGLEIGSSAETVTENESLSAEATALLFMQRRFGNGFLAGVPRAHLFNERFIGQLRRIGHRRLTFSTQAWGPVLDRHAADLAWIEERLGEGLAETPVADALPIASEDDLTALGSACYSDLERILLERVSTIELPARQKTVLLLELLQKAGHF